MAKARQLSTEDVENQAEGQMLPPCQQTPNKNPLQLNVQILNQVNAKLTATTPKRAKSPIAVAADDYDDLYDMGSIRPVCFRASILMQKPSADQPSTPKANRKSLLSAQATETHKSPLLKIAYISSHGKRLSRNNLN